MDNIFDKFKSAALEGFLKNKFSSYFENGDVSVDLNTSKATCVFRAMLAGESERTCIEVLKFEVVGDTEKKLVIREVKCDKKWLDRALNDHLKDREIALPSFMANAL